MSKQVEFYEKLKESLDISTDFPAEYLFKFIVPTTKNQLNEVKHVFDMSGAVIRTKNSKTNKTTKVSTKPTTPPTTINNFRLEGKGSIG